MAWLPVTRASTRLPQATLAVLLIGGVPRPAAAEPEGQPLELRFAAVVRPFVKPYCLPCHGARKTEAKLDLSGYPSAAGVVKDHRLWEHVRERLEAEEMPPEKAPRQPPSHERR